MPATYIGPIEHLKGKTALIRAATHGYVVAQFDDFTLTRSGQLSVSRIDEVGDESLGIGWHAFPEGDFEVKS